MTRTCATCGTSIAHRQRNARTCSNACRQRATRSVLPKLSDWEPWEDRVLRTSTDLGHAHRRLSHRSLSELRERLHGLGMTLADPPTCGWTREEDATVAAAVWADLPKLADRLGRSFAAVRARYSKLKRGIA